ncbi:hypothetical protein UFOVP23_25 [uncultured Caudovirales phage]|uniref:Terminase small subunit n=1 Tax=uncultured Caudovirales phage TaxID=2100421 RepID=A0A6J5TBG7_9CAUD|nr:hypothetical protein UFOVP23_25 [uncultured Caudovirales phage]
MGKRINTSTNNKQEEGCDKRFLALSEKGGSIAEFCLQEKISRTTFDAWCSKYPYMAQAKAMGKKLAEGWWLNMARNHLVITNDKETTTKFDTNLYKFITGGRFGHTGDKNLNDELEDLKRIVAEMQSSSQPKIAYAEEPSYEENHEDKT